MNKSKSKSNKKLSLHAESLRILTASELTAAVGGGGGTDPVATEGCTTVGGPTDICTFTCPK